MGAKAQRKYDKGWNPMPGFQVVPEDKRALDERIELERERQKQKDAAKRLRAQGFEFDKFVNHVKRFTK